MKLREQGMTLLEVMVAVLVLGVGLFTSASLQMRALHAAEGARRDAQVVQLGQSLIEQTRSAGQLQPAALHDWRACLEALLGSSGRGNLLAGCARCPASDHPVAGLGLAMSARQRGFGLMEALLALALGLMVLAAAGQVLFSGQQLWRGILLQEDAMLVLQRLALDIRMTASFGCLSPEAVEFQDASARQAFAHPLHIEHLSDGRLARLSLVTAELSGTASSPDWTLHTDCLEWAQVHGKRHSLPGAPLSIGLRRHTYRLQGGSLILASGGFNASLIDNVRDFRVTRVEAEQGTRLDLQLILDDLEGQVERTYALSVALRNRLPPS